MNGPSAREPISTFRAWRDRVHIDLSKEFRQCRPMFKLTKAQSTLYIWTVKGTSSFEEPVTELVSNLPKLSQKKLAFQIKAGKIIDLINQVHSLIVEKPKLSNNSNIRKIGNLCTTTTHLINPVLVMRLILSPMILVIGILGNAFGYLMILTLKKGDLHYFFLKWICLFNMLTGAAYWLLVAKDIRAYLISPFTTDLGYMTFSARFNLMLINSFFNSGTMCLCFVMLDRYVALCHPLKYASFRKRPWLRRMPGLIFLINLAMTFTNYTWFGVKSCIDRESFQRKYYMTKIEEPRWAIRFDIFTSVVQYILPGILMFFLGINISMALVRYFRAKNAKKRFVYPRTNPAPTQARCSYKDVWGNHDTALKGVPLSHSSINVRQDQSDTTTNVPHLEPNLSLQSLKVPGPRTKNGRSKVEPINVSNINSTNFRPNSKIKTLLTHSSMATNPVSPSPGSVKGSLKNVSTLVHFLAYCLLNIPTALIMIFRQKIEHYRYLSPKLVDSFIASANLFEVTFVAVNVYIYFIFDDNFHQFFRCDR